MSATQYLLLACEVVGYLREANCQVRTAHSCAALMLHDAPQMQYQCSQCCVVGIRQVIDALVQRIATPIVFVNLRGGNKGIIAGTGEQRVWQLPEKLLQQARNTIDIVEEVRRVTEVKLWRGRRQGIKGVAQGIRMARSAADTVDTLDVEAKEVDSLHTLEHNHWDSRAVAGEERVETDTENRTTRGGCDSIGELAGSSVGGNTGTGGDGNAADLLSKRGTATGAISRVCRIRGRAIAVIWRCCLVW